MFQGNNSGGDYRRKYLIMGAIIVVFIVYSLIRAGHYVTVSSPSAGELRVEAKSANENASEVGYLTLEGGVEMVFTADLSAGSLLTEVFVEGEDGEPVQLFGETYRGSDTGTFDVEEGGEYAVRVTASAGTTGTMSVRTE